MGSGAFHPANMHKLPLECTRHIEDSSQLETTSVQGSAATGILESLQPRYTEPSCRDRGGVLSQMERSASERTHSLLFSFCMLEI